MIAHNRHAGSLSFQSSFLNHWRASGRAGVRGGRRWRKNKNSLQAPQAGLVEAAQAGFRRQAPAQRPRRGGALQRPRRALHTALKAGEVCKLSPDQVSGWTALLQLLLLAWEVRTLIPALELPPASNPKQGIHRVVFLRGNLLLPQF